MPDQTHAQDPQPDELEAQFSNVIFRLGLLVLILALINLVF